MADGDQQQQSNQQQGGGDQQQQNQQQAKPWYDGKADAETVGYWQNRGWKPEDAGVIALEATKAAREAQKFVGADPKLLIRLPADPVKDADGMRAVWQRLGTPKESKEYDFATVKHADGTAIAPAFADTIRETAFSANIPKDAATAFAQSIVKHLDQQKAAAAAEAKAKWEEGVANVKKNWGPNQNLNELAAKQGTARLGLTQEQYESIAKAVGVDVAAEMFRKIGAGTSEDTFVEGKGGGAPTTAAAAAARLVELNADKAWVDRLFKGDAAARREHDSLTQQIAAAA